MFMFIYMKLFLVFLFLKKFFVSCKFHFLKNVLKPEIFKDINGSRDARFHLSNIFYKFLNIFGRLVC